MRHQTSHHDFPQQHPDFVYGLAVAAQSCEPWRIRGDWVFKKVGLKETGMQTEGV